MSENLEITEVETGQTEAQEKEAQEKLDKKDQFKPTAPDFVGDDHNACAWVLNRNTDGHIVKMRVKIGEFRFNLRKRFL